MPDPNTLPPGQRKVLEIIRTFIAEHGYSPTIREIGRIAENTSANGPMNSIKRLVKKGFITRGKGARLIQLIEDKPTYAQMQDLLKQLQEENAKLREGMGLAEPNVPV